MVSLSVLYSFIKALRNSNAIAETEQIASVIYDYDSNFRVQIVGDIIWY